MKDSIPTVPCEFQLFMPDGAFDIQVSKTGVVTFRMSLPEGFLAIVNEDMLPPRLKSHHREAIRTAANHAALTELLRQQIEIA